LHTGTQAYCGGTIANTPCPSNLTKSNCELITGCYWVPAVAGEEVLVSNVALNGNEGIWSLGQLEAEQKTCYGVAWSVPLDTGNIIQTDSVTGDLTFYVEQVRNNPNFSCQNLVPR
jgi:hypothetical protein